MKELNENNIENYYHCKICINELQNATSTKDLSMIDPKLSQYTPRTYARLEVGLTKQGFQVWCVRHNLNVIHIDFKGQEVDIETTKDIDSEDANTWLAKGMQLIKLEKYDEGIRCFNEVIRFEGVDHYALCGAWNEKGLACSHLEKYEEAITCYDEAIQIDPNYWNAWNNQGEAFYDQEKYEEAITCYDEAIRINPDNESVWNDKGNASFYLEKYEEAITCYDEAIRINPENYSAWGNKGDSLKKLGRDEDAEQCFTKSKELQ